MAQLLIPTDVSGVHAQKEVVLNGQREPAAKTLNLRYQYWRSGRSKVSYQSGAV